MWEVEFLSREIGWLYYSLMARGYGRITLLVKREELVLGMLDLKCLCNLQVKRASIPLSEMDLRMRFGKSSTQWSEDSLGGK